MFCSRFSSKSISFLKSELIHHQTSFDSQCSELIFAPNKPSQMAPSTKGSRLFLPGLIKFCITDGQENKIWLEKIAGLKRDYRVSIIIDVSSSCFNPFISSHSIQTVVSLISVFAKIEVPFFDLILATESSPIVLAINQNSQRILDPSSDIWNSIFSNIPFKSSSSNLFDAIEVAMKIKSSNSTKRSYLFVLTDGIVSSGEKLRIQNLFRSCRECSIEVFGIGLGFYPIGISTLFFKCTWSVNPKFLLTAISGLFGNNIPNTLENIRLFADSKSPASIVSEEFRKISSVWPNACVYKDLYKKLRDQTLYSESIDQYQNEIEGLEGLGVNPDVTPDSSMYKQNSFQSQKILICCFWSKVLGGKEESEWVDPIYLSKRFKPDEECVAEVLQYYGIEIEVVQNYRDAILKMQTGQFYAIWVICGAGDGRLPDGGNAHLIDQFISCVDIFWKSGGSVVWWADNEPLFYELNEFLENSEFPPTEQFPSLVKSPLRLGPGSEGKQTLRAGNISTVKLQVFNNQRRFNFQKYSRPSLAHNLNFIYEGYTISNAANPSTIAPFQPFSFDSKGGISSLFYLADYDQSCGDMVIDAGFTKLFTELKTDGTLRYVQNIAALTGQYEKHYWKGGENGPKTFRPASFKFTIDDTKKSTRLKPTYRTGPFDVVYMVDATGSMGGYIQAAKDQCINISNTLQKQLSQYQFQFGCIFYRDPIDSPSDVNDIFMLTDNVLNLKNQIQKVNANGGGDGPEDWVGAYRLSLSMNWRNGIRLIIHMADAPAHGAIFGGAGHEPEAPLLIPLIQQCAARKIKIIGMPIGGSYSQPSYDQCQRNYPLNEDNLYQITPFAGGGDISTYFRDSVVNAVICAAPK